MERKTYSIFDSFYPNNVLLTFDALVSEKHNRSLEITTSPVEGGTNITDFVIRNPRVLNIEGFVTNNPIVKSSFTPEEIQLYTKGIISQTQQLQGIAERELEDRRKIVYDALEKIYRRKMVVNVLTNLDLYESMIIEDYDITLNSFTGSGMPINISFKQIIVAWARAEEIARVLEEENGTDLQNASKSDLGQKNAKKYLFIRASAMNVGL